MTTTNTPSKTRILIVDDDPVVCESLSDLLAKRGYDAATAMGGEEALDALADAERGAPDRPPQPFSVVVTDVDLAGRSGTDLLREVRKRHPDVVVIIVTAYGTIESAVNAIKLGAFDYLTHPVVEDELALIVEKGARHGVLLARNSRLERELGDRYGLDHIIGRDARMLRTYDLIEAVAPTKTTVLMLGESGTGKSLIARAIHERSAAREGPYVELSCGSIPETLLESELFGHVKGAFTGAHADKAGRFLAADAGTIFLDEINSASPGMQLKLLRVLQERRFEPVGSTKTVEVNVRVILASNQPLERMVAEGRFRQDLYYRINVVRIELPPLRDRAADVPLLAKHFLEKHGDVMGRHLAGFAPEAMAALQRYTYPGNVRELENIVERAVVLTRSNMIQVEDLPASVVQNRPLTLVGAPGDDGSGSAGAAWAGEPLAEALEEHERRIILAALAANNWNRQKTAQQLGVNRTTLYKKIKAYRIDQMPEAG